MSAPTSAPTRRPKRQLTDEQKAAAEARRAALVARSGPIQTAQKMGLLPWCFFETVNAAIQFQYACETKQVVWHTFHDWRDRGYRVKKGEVGFAIWSAPQQSSSQGEASEGNGEASEGGEATSSGRPLFRLCYLFHLGQVEPIPGHEQAPLKATIDVEATQRALDALTASLTPVQKSS